MHHLSLPRRFRRSAALALAVLLMAASAAPAQIMSCLRHVEPMPQGIWPRDWPKVPPPSAHAAAVPPGYQVEVVVQDLTYPSSVEFDDWGNMYVAEAGFAYGDLAAPARILRIAPDGRIEIVAEQLNGPINDILWYAGRLYISHFGTISALEPNGCVVDLVTGLPASGGHQNNQLTVGPDGKIYFGMGTVTNSGVVGLDEIFPYLTAGLWPDIHDVPPCNLALTGETFATPHANNVIAKQSALVTTPEILVQFVASVFAPDRKGTLLAKTGAFQPFGHDDAKVVRGSVKASGTILRLNPDGSCLEVYAWGLRNPYGVMWGPDGRLYASNNGYDDRGSRPIANAKDDIWLIQQGCWYGWPDYSSGIPVTHPMFRSERGLKETEFLLKHHWPVPCPLMTRPKHSGLTKIEFGTNPEFGFAGQMFLCEFGAGVPLTGQSAGPVGHQVVAVDLANCRMLSFFRAKDECLGPCGWEYVLTQGPKHPVDARFSPDGRALYVADLGALKVLPTGAAPFPRPFPGTGAIWRITRVDGGPVIGPPPGLSPSPPRATFGPPAYVPETHAPAHGPVVRVPMPAKVPLAPTRPPAGAPAAPPVDAPAPLVVPGR